MTRLASMLIVLAAVTTADAKPKARPAAGGGKASVKVHMDRAAKAHKAGKFDVALHELEAAYAIEPQPKLDFAIAQVEQKLDKCDDAIGHYEKFLAATKDKAKQQVVEQAIDACKKKLAKTDDARPDKPDGGVFRKSKPPADQLPTSDAKPAIEAKPAAQPKPEPTPVEAAPPAEPSPPPPVEEPPPAPRAVPANDAPVAVSAQASPKRHHWYADPLGDALVAAGIGAAAGSVFIFTRAQSDLDKAEAATSLDAYHQYHDRAERKQLYTFVLAGGGVALIGAGVLRFAMRRDRTESAGVAVVPTRDGGFVTWSGGF